MEFLQYFDAMWIGAEVELSDGRKAFVVSVGAHWVIVSDGAMVARIPREEFDKVKELPRSETPAE